MRLKAASESYPLWISSNGHIILETFLPTSMQAQTFLTTIAEPVSRPALVNEYRITPYSLYAAVSMGHEADYIIAQLDAFSKNEMDPQLKEFIKSCTVNYGKLKLVLRNGRFWLEPFDRKTLQILLGDPLIAESRCIATEDAAAGAKRASSKNEAETSTSLAFEINPEYVEPCKKRCNELEFPVIEEYDYLNDTKNATIAMDLRASTCFRSYQEQALSKMFKHDRARSGIIVLPCGAGKTLVGIAAANTIKKSVLVLCTSAVAAEQWRTQFVQFTDLPMSSICRFTSDSKERPTSSAGVIVSTYTMIAYSGKRSYEAKKLITFIESIEWGLLILDEVHVVPANVFRKVLTTVAAHAKLGLTATLVREDEKIDDLNFLIGPKLYEANWQDLARDGHIANVQCAEVWCAMPAAFYREYLLEKSKKRRLLYAMNPTKFQTCQHLIKFHEARKDKIIVFSDNVYALKAYALRLQKPFIYGPTSQAERMQVLQKFQSDPNVNTIFLSKVGDTSIDLPEATCLIQISSHYGSRRQEAQRLGRILRAKNRNTDGFNAYFYSLVSKDTEEMYYSTKRQQFLIDQGYAFKTITTMPDLHRTENLVYNTDSAQMELLREVLLATEADAEEEFVDEIDAVENIPYQRLASDLRTLSGAGDMAHYESHKRVRL